MKKILSFIVNEKGELLLLRNNPSDPTHGGDFWCVVTGGIEDHDSNDIDAVKREIKEETSLDVNEVLYLNYIFEYIHNDIKCIEYVYISFVNSSEIILNEENIDYKWCNLEEFIKFMKWYDNKSVLRKVLKKAINKEKYFIKEKTINCVTKHGNYMFKRVAAFLIDYSIVCYLASPFLLMSIYYNMDGTRFVIFSSLYVIIALVLALLKDILYKKSSIGKNTMGLKIKSKDGKEPSIGALILRNITFFIWPVEFLILLITKKRITDEWLNLEVIEFRKPNLFGKIVLGFLKFYFYLIIFMLFIAILIMFFL